MLLSVLAGVGLQVDKFLNPGFLLIILRCLSWFSWFFSLHASDFYHLPIEEHLVSSSSISKDRVLNLDSFWNHNKLSRLSIQSVFNHLLGTTAVTLFVLLGTPAGYTSARLYKTFGGERWKTNVLLTAFLVSGFIFAMFFVMNLILWGEGSSAAVPFTTILGSCSHMQALLSCHWNLEWGVSKD